MLWVRKKFKKCKVYVLVDENNKIITENGLAQIKYRNQEDEKIYNAQENDIYELNEENKISNVAPEKNIQKKLSQPQISKVEFSHSNQNTSDEIVIYTDGACLGNPGSAGIGIVLTWGEHTKEISEYIGEGTNNIAELTAIKVALESLKTKKHPVKLYTDSQYSLSALDGTFKTRKNVELIDGIKKLIASFEKLEILKVLGHSGIWGNEKADKLAQSAANKNG